MQRGAQRVVHTAAPAPWPLQMPSRLARKFFTWSSTEAGTAAGAAGAAASGRCCMRGTKPKPARDAAQGS